MHAFHKRILVKDVMKTEFTMIDGKASVYEALLMMKKQVTSMLVVDKRNSDDEYGLLLVSDVAQKVLALDRPSRRVNVYEVMTKPAVCVEPDMDIRYCSRLFARFNLVRVLVVEGDKLLGYVSPSRLVLDGLFDLECE